LASPELQTLWTEFLAAWPPERVRDMTIEEYTNLDKDGAFVYWLESRTEKLGSVWGGSAFKWGVYRRNDTSKRKDGRGVKWTSTYAWYVKYGDTAEQAFQTIRSRLVEVIEAARAGDLERIESMDVGWPIVKWKVAFLYQDREHPCIFPLFHEDRLFQQYRVIAPGARPAETNRAVMYPTLLDRHASVGDVFDISHELWRRGDAESAGRPARYWAVPLSIALTMEEATALCAVREVSPEDVPALVDEQLVAGEVARGDHLALLVGTDVRAVAEVLVAEARGFVWSQRPVAVTPDIVVPAKVTELDAEARDAIWGQIPAAVPGAVQYWKIAPGERGKLWEDWRKGSYIAIGWDLFGDVSKDTQESFAHKVDQLADKSGYGRRGVWQVWKFRNLPVGTRIVANRGIGEALGFGTIIAGYEYHPAEGEYCHRHRVRWDDLTPRTILRKDFLSTLIQLDAAEFAALQTAPHRGEDVPAAPMVDPEPPAGPCPEPESIILYGPPGTGKTWSTTERALQILLGPGGVPTSEDARAILFRNLQRNGRIEFVTFHQSYGYEEFVEGIRPVLDVGAGGDVRYEVHHGAFKRIALRAAAEGLRVGADPDTFGALWQRLVDEIAAEGERVVHATPGKSYVLRRTAQGNLEALLCEVDPEGNVTTLDKKQVASKDNVKLIWDHRMELGVEPGTFTYDKTRAVFAADRGGDGGHHYTAIRLVYGELLTLSRSGRARDQVARPAAADRVQEALDRPDPGTVDFEFTDRTRPYVLVIDEINRGNISKILGELITLLEPDKRLRAPNELKLPLAYTPKHRFAVPPNLHIIGTMNTADRSIALMDVALRRRFRFEEMLPDVGVLRRQLEKKAVSAALVELTCDLFTTLNDRIRFLYDRDHQIGHAYFLRVRTLADLRSVFADRVIPLLQEYFYGAWDKVCMVLGCPYDETGRPRRKGPGVRAEGKEAAYLAPMVLARRQDEVAVLGFDHDELESRIDLEIAPAFRPRAGGAALAEAELAAAFLGLLNLKPEEMRLRKDAVLSVAPAPVATAAVEPIEVASPTLPLPAESDAAAEA
jgi:5-methylcytosine-specific restriction endonuclease McrBC GTP-binding regulatory subunit McrB